MDTPDRDTAELEALLAEAVPTFRRRARALVVPTPKRPPEPGAGGAHAWRHGIRGLQSAVDHLAAWQLLSKQRPRPVMAHYTLLRGAIDGAAMARWLFDPTVDANGRAGRGYRAELADMLQLKKIDDLDPQIVAEGPSGSELVDAVGASAASEGVEIASREESRFSALATEYAGYKSLYKGPGTHLYAVLSAAAHGRVWARHLAHPNAVIRQPGAADERIIIMDASTATWATRKVVEIVDRAMRDAEVYARGLGTIS